MGTRPRTTLDITKRHLLRMCRGVLQFRIVSRYSSNHVRGRRVPESQFERLGVRLRPRCRSTTATPSVRAAPPEALCENRFGQFGPLALRAFGRVSSFRGTPNKVFARNPWNRVVPFCFSFQGIQKGPPPERRSLLWGFRDFRLGHLHHGERRSARLAKCLGLRDPGGRARHAKPNAAW